jgi:TRAP-type C4-dicarboxylate transport system substrate-binding protein
VNIKKNKVIAIVLQVFIVIVIFASVAYAKPVVLRVSGTSPIGYRGTQSLFDIKAEVEKATEGRVTFKVFPANQLGDASQVFTEVKRGTIEMALMFIPSQYDKIFEIGSLPYLADSYSQMEKLLGPGGYVYKLMDKALDKQGMKYLGTYADGFCGIGSTKLPDNPSDPTVSKGNSLCRIPAMSAYKYAAEGLGYKTTTIPWSDTFSAAQTGVCDAWLGASPQINYQVMGDVIKYYMPYNVVFDQSGYIINKKVWDSISEADRKIIEKAVNNEVRKSFASCEAEDVKYMKMLEEKGVKVIKFNDKEFKAMVAHVRGYAWPKLEGTFGKEVFDGLKKEIK